MTEEEYWNWAASDVGGKCTCAGSFVCPKHKRDNPPAEWSRENLWDAYVALWKDRDAQEHRAAKAERALLEPPADHTEMLSPPLKWGPPDFRDRHLSDEPDDTRLFDPRCPKCVWDWTQKEKP